ncbi:MAG: protein translocase SEC61 complex gamma subunit [halophilic archaeon J07HB67]|nr:MAG: protein translocase SEC61 complex gamma subunit [halophilic archaeon J07HB67]
MVTTRVFRQIYESSPSIAGNMDVKYELSEYVRVLKLASQPEWEEFSQVSKIAGAGVFLVGLIGFLIYVVMFFVTGGV